MTKASGPDTAPGSDRAALEAHFAEATPGTVIVHASGNWNVRQHPPDSRDIQELLLGKSIRGVVLSARDLGAWDTSLVAALTALVRLANERKLSVMRDPSIPEGVYNLIDLALSVPPHRRDKSDEDPGFLARLGEKALRVPKKALDVLLFIGEVTISFGRMLKGKAVCPARNIWLNIQEAGVDALPIISLISLLVGLILAFVGVVQLRMFGAEIYVSSLVAIGMTRIMGAVMTGVVLAGRTGAAYAAVIGSMQVNEEIDALESLGIPPTDYLVLPRCIALTLMTPLLVLYADFMGIIGGFIVGSVILNIDPLEYLNHTQRMLRFSHISVGLIHGLAFGMVIAVTGCYQGLRCGRSAAAVGTAATSAVVNAIVALILVTAMLTILFNLIGL